MASGPMIWLSCMSCLHTGSSLASLLPLDSVTVVRPALGTLYLLGPYQFLISPEFLRETSADLAK